MSEYRSYVNMKHEKKIKPNDPRIMHKLEELEAIENEYDSSKILMLRKAVRKQMEFDQKYI